MARAVLVIPIILAIFGLIGFNVYLSVYGQSKASPTTSLLPIASPASSNAFSSFPALFPKDGWLGYYTPTGEMDTFVSTLNYFSKQKEGKEELSGTFYTQSIQVHDIKQLFNTNQFSKYWNDELAQVGFTGDLQKDGYRFTGPSADSSLSSVLGLVRENDGFIQLTSYSYNLKAESFGEANEVLNPTCPCETTLILFISDPIKIHDIVND